MARWWSAVDRRRTLRRTASLVVRLTGGGALRALASEVLVAVAGAATKWLTIAANGVAAFDTFSFSTSLEVRLPVVRLVVATASDWGSLTSCWRSASVTAPFLLVVLVLLVEVLADGIDIVRVVWRL